MINLIYNISQKKLKCQYLKSLFSTKFGVGKNAKSVKSKFDSLKNDYPYNIIFRDIEFDDIIFSTPNNLKCLINKIEIRIIEQSKIEYKTINNKKVLIYTAKEKLKEIFKYNNKFQVPISRFFEKNLKTRTCYFCNIHLVNEYQVNEYQVNEKEYKNEFTLDHYYDKGSYPYMALSLYNLIASCYTCNSKLKGTKKLNLDPPNSKNFNFNEQVKFKLFLSDNCTNLHIKNQDDIAISLKEKYSNKYEKYIKVFKLNERYQAHKDIIFEMMQKAELYPESRLKELQELTGIPCQQIKKDIFNLLDDNVDLSKKPFSKLIKDISQELGLIK